jgi:phage shock protein E
MLPHRQKLDRARLWIASLVLVAAPLAACASTPPPAPAKTAEVPPAEAAPPLTDPATAKQLVHDGARLLDVRTPKEYAEKHIEGAENAPLDTIGEQDLGPKDTPLVVYCHSGKRAARAAAKLRAKGYTRVYDLGAMSNWGD